jgi:stage IV sporulation protein A
LKKPFIIVINSKHPTSGDTIRLAAEMEEKFGIPVLPVDVAHLNENDILNILENALYEFPVIEVNINLPRWVDELEESHWLRGHFRDEVGKAIEDVNRLRDIDGAIEFLAQSEYAEEVSLADMNLGTGSASIEIKSKEGLFFKVLQELTGYEIEGEHNLLPLMQELSAAKKEFDKVASGIQDGKNTGYGIVIPTIDELELGEPELTKHGRGGFGVKLKASAPSYHFIRADITTEITPMIGTQEQCEELIEFIKNEFEHNPEKIWQTQVFGKPLSEVVRESIQSKLYKMPENAQSKLQETLERILNEGSGGLICIII